MLRATTDTSKDTNGYVEGEESADGDLVHDSHAEVVAKRAFVLYLVTMTLHISSLFFFRKSTLVLSTLNV